MKYFFLLSISFISLKCIAQNDTTDFKHRHRLWINPTQIVTGQYTLAYGLRFNKNNWIEIGAGYKYIPYSIVQKLPIAPASFFELFADPEHGVGFTGPVAMVSFIHYHHGKIFNGACIELFYQHLNHSADCYYVPDANSNNRHFTYASTKDNYGGKFLLLNTIASSHHLIWQFYIGGGLRLGYGETTTYFNSNYTMYYGDHFCVDDIHDPNVSTSQAPFNYVAPSVNVGIRLGLQ